MDLVREQAPPGFQARSLPFFRKDNGDANAKVDAKPLRFQNG